MSKHMTIINLACTITKVRKWGEAWKHSAESAQAASAELHRKHKEAERIIETLRANLTQTEAESRVESLRLKAELAVVKDERDQLRVERDALRAQLDAERAPKPVDGPRSHPVKVGEWVERTKGYLSVPAGTVAQVTGMELSYQVRLSDGRAYEWEPAYCAPCDPPEATHITPEGKATAQAAVTPQPGDTVRLVRFPTPKEWDKHGKHREWWDEFGKIGELAIVMSNDDKPCSLCVGVVRAEGLCMDWPLSCVEVVKGGDK